ncbi:Solute carrier family 35 member E3 [Coccomyxa sp. Obi]|nr:Solute carrier family 35 member E3 [Coccomyxa sp. Obi]
MAALSGNQMKAVLYILLNVGSGTSIVFANKVVLSVYKFHFVYALTLIHTAVTMVGMWSFAGIGLYQRKPLKARQILPLAAAFVGYIVFWNLSLQLNSVGFYQLSKILIAPAIIIIEAVWFSKLPSRLELAAVALLCIGVTLATVSDSEVTANLPGLLMSGLAIWTTSIYQIWAGSKQKEYQVSSMQLMDNYCPYAAGLLCVLVPIFEPLGFNSMLNTSQEDTLLNYNYTPAIVGAIALTAVLGLLVSLSTFLVIGATSSLTYNVMGHLKTVIILAGGFVLFDEAMPPKKLAGVLCALGGIIWYSGLKMQQKSGAGGNGSASKAVPGRSPPPATTEAEPLIATGADKVRSAAV